MATCCTTTIIPFVNQTSTAIPFIGDQPTITVAYLVSGVWYALGVATQIILGDGVVTVDHGGSQTGVIKMVQ